VDENLFYSSEYNLNSPGIYKQIDDRDVKLNYTAPLRFYISNGIQNTVARVSIRRPRAQYFTKLGQVLIIFSDNIKIGVKYI
jgi:hypothetical protein